MVPKSYILDLSNKETTILSCNTKIQILIKSQGQFISKRLFVAKDFVILSWTNISIKINLAILFDRDFIFLLSKYLVIIFYYYMVDVGTNKIFAQNNLPSITQISKQTSLKLMSKIKYCNCFQIFDCNDMVTWPSRLI